MDFEAGGDFILGKFRHDSSSGAESAGPAFRIAASAALFDELAACWALPPHDYEVGRTGQFGIHLIGAPET